MSTLLQQYFSNNWQLRRLLMSRFLAVSETVGLSATQGEIVMALIKHNNQPAKELAQTLRLSAGAISQHLDSLEKLGCIKRTTSSDDRRLVNIEVNESDGKVLRMRAYIADLNAEITSQLDEDTIYQLIRGQEKLLAILETTKEKS